MAGALDGIRVIEVASYLTGPYAAMLLADLGADVIKVEPPAGDPFRGWEEHHYSSNFRCVNRNKRSVVLDLKTDSGRGALLKMIERADVLVQNLRPDAAERLGIDYASLQRAHPRLVYCSISGFGETGPDRDRAGYDTVGQAMSGLLGLLTDLKTPAPVGISLSDHVTGLFACYGILGALYARERTGKGQKVETSLLRAGVSLAQEAASRYFTTGKVPARETRVHAAQVFAFVAADGLPFVVHLSSPPKFWEGLTDAIARPELRADERFKDRPARVKNYPALREILAQAFAGRSREAWLSRLHGHDVPCGPIQSMEEVFNSPQVQAMGMPVNLPHPEMGEVRLSGSGVELSATPVRYELAPPLLGEHTEQVLREIGWDAR